MRFYNQQHAFYYGIDLHKKTMYLCIIDVNGEIVLHKNIRTRRADFMRAVAPFQQGVVVACECMFAWSWIADLCEKHEIDFVLGHVLYMRAIYGAKTKNDRQDAYKIAHLLRGGDFPLAYTYPADRRQTRDLLWRRSHFRRRRAELLTHVQNTITRYNLPPLKKRVAYKANRAGAAEHFPDVHVRRSIEADLVLLDYYDEVLSQLELHLERTAKSHDAHTRMARVRSPPREHDQWHVTKQICSFRASSKQGRKYLGFKRVVVRGPVLYLRECLPLPVERMIETGLRSKGR